MRNALFLQLLLLVSVEFYTLKLISATILLKPSSISFPDLPAKFGILFSFLKTINSNSIFNFDFSNFFFLFGCGGSSFSA